MSGCGRTITLQRRSTGSEDARTAASQRRTKLISWRATKREEQRYSSVGASDSRASGPWNRRRGSTGRSSKNSSKRGAPTTTTRSGGKPWRAAASVRCRSFQTNIRSGGTWSAPLVLRLSQLNTSIPTAIPAARGALDEVGLRRAKVHAWRDQYGVGPVAANKFVMKGIARDDTLDPCQQLAKALDLRDRQPRNQAVPEYGIGDPHLGPQPVDDAHAQLVGTGIVGAEILDPVAQPPHERCVRSPCVPARGWRRFEHQSCEVEAVCHPVVTARLPVLKRQPNGVFLPKQRGDGGTECIDVLLLPCNDQELHRAGTIISSRQTSSTSAGLGSRHPRRVQRPGPGGGSCGAESGGGPEYVWRSEGKTSGSGAPNDGAQG